MSVCFGLGGGVIIIEARLVWIHPEEGQKSERLHKEEQGGDL